jgi:5'-3' exonuclease
VFDHPGKNFRHRLFPEYKINRAPARALELSKQLPLMRPVAEVLGLTPVEHKGYEADDVVATLATRARAAGIRSTIVSSDKDFAQLVEDGWIEIVDPMQHSRDPSKSSRRLEADVIKKFGVPPSQVPDVQALAGDTADGIPGIAGIGIDKAAALIRRFGSVEEVLKHHREVRWPTIRAELAKHGDDARLYLKLTTLKRNVPVKVAIADMAIRPIMKSHLIQVVKALDPNAHVEALFGLDLQDVRIVDRVADPLEWWREELFVSGQPLPAVPPCGFYRTRIVRGGPWVPARIWREPYLDPDTGADSGKDVLRCEINGKDKDAMAVYPWLCRHPTKESEFQFQVADFDHAKNYRPDDPKATPAAAIEITKQPAPRNPRRKKTT